MELLKNETLITKSDSDIVTLTTYRIRYQDDNNLTSIMLDQISGIDIRYASKPILILIALICGVAGLYMMNETDGTIGIILLIAAAIAVFAFLGSRKHVISISSASSNIIFHTKGMDQKSVHDFVNQIEESRFNYPKL